jgi:hypothetical protein
MSRKGRKRGKALAEIPAAGSTSQPGTPKPHDTGPIPGRRSPLALSRKHPLRSPTPNRRGR